MSARLIAEREALAEAELERMVPWSDENREMLEVRPEDVHAELVRPGVNYERTD